MSADRRLSFCCDLEKNAMRAGNVAHCYCKAQIGSLDGGQLAGHGEVESDDGMATK